MIEAAPAPRTQRSLVLAMASISLSAACLVGGYEFARSAAASLFIGAYGSGPMPYAMTVVPLVMAAFIYVYGRILSRMGSRWTLQLSLGCSAAAFLAAYLALCTGWKPAVAATYIFTEAYIVILVEQFWSFINSTLDQSNAKIFNGPILGGSSIGPILAGVLLRRFAPALGSEQFILLSGLSLIPAALLADTAYRLAGEPQPSARERGGAMGSMHLRLIVDNRVLLFIGIVVALSQFFAVSANLRLYALLEQAMPGQDARTAYLGTFWAMANGLAFLMQFVLTPLVLKRLPLRVILVGIPLVHLCTAGLMLSIPALPVAALALMVFKGLDYSVFRASKELLYIPLSFDARYRAKQVVDALNNRFSKGVAAGLISLAKGLAGDLPGWLFPAVSLAAAGAWAAAAVPLARAAAPEESQS
ncbi:MAG: Npt1/Npt2 family nucleotide transporter [Elusimicrobiota bacterium]|jgi:AAA family ATP:ADP antiporter